MASRPLRHTRYGGLCPPKAQALRSRRGARGNRPWTQLKAFSNTGKALRAQAREMPPNIYKKGQKAN